MRICCKAFWATASKRNTLQCITQSDPYEARTDIFLICRRYVKRQKRARVRCMSRLRSSGTRMANRRLNARDFCASRIRRIHANSSTSHCGPLRRYSIRRHAAHRCARRASRRANAAGSSPEFSGAGRMDQLATGRASFGAFFHIARSSPATSAHFEALNRRRAFKPADLPTEIRKRTPAAANIEIVVSRRYDSTLLDFADSLDWANAK